MQADLGSPQHRAPSSHHCLAPSCDPVVSSHHPALSSHHPALSSRHPALSSRPPDLSSRRPALSSRGTKRSIDSSREIMDCHASLAMTARQVARLAKNGPQRSGFAAHPVLQTTAPRERPDSSCAVAAAAGRLDFENIAGLHLDLGDVGQVLDAAIAAQHPVAAGCAGLTACGAEGRVDTAV